MAVLVVTDRTQGLRGNDFLSPDATVGELVDITSSCDSDRGEPDGGCGCCRSFTDLVSRYCTTTAEVVERELTMEQYVEAHLASLVRAGLPADGTTRAWAAEAAQDMARIAAAFPIGTVVERRGDDIQERTQ
jgi:hypothetical protein